jgi:hypothetical protein
VTLGGPGRSILGRFKCWHVEAGSLELTPPNFSLQSSYRGLPQFRKTPLFCAGHIPDYAGGGALHPLSVGVLKAYLWRQVSEGWVSGSEIVV